MPSRAHVFGRRSKGPTRRPACLLPRVERVVGVAQDGQLRSGPRARARRRSRRSGAAAARSGSSTPASRPSSRDHWPAAITTCSARTCRSASSRSQPSAVACSAVTGGCRSIPPRGRAPAAKRVGHRPWGRRGRRWQVGRAEHALRDQQREELRARSASTSSTGTPAVSATPAWSNWSSRSRVSAMRTEPVWWKSTGEAGVGLELGEALELARKCASGWSRLHWAHSPAACQVEPLVSSCCSSSATSRQPRRVRW